jgi:hypothetical protein
VYAVNPRARDEGVVVALVVVAGGMRARPHGDDAGPLALQVDAASDRMETRGIIVVDAGGDRRSAVVTATKDAGGQCVQRPNGMQKNRRKKRGPTSPHLSPDDF